MPVLKKERHNSIIILPVSKGSVTLVEYQTYGDFLKIRATKDGDTTSLLQIYIQDWDFTNEAGEKLEINEENLSFVPMEDVSFILDTVVSKDKGETSEEDKKKEESN